MRETRYMRIPFEKLVEAVQDMGTEDMELPMGVLAERLETTAERLSDAVTAARMLNGERTYISVQ